MKTGRKIIQCIRVLRLVGFHSFAFCLMAVLNLSCSDSPKQRGGDRDDLQNRKTKQNKPPASYGDTIIINFPAAVFYYPDSMQLEDIKAITDTMMFKSMEHECIYQMRNSRLAAKDYSPQVRVVEALEAGYLLFIKSDNTKIYVDLNSKDDMCGLFLFDQVKEPLLVDMTNIGTELDFYFRK